MVLKEVDFTAMYVCVSIVREVSIHYCLFTSVRKVQHCTGYPLIQVEIVSVCKNHYVCWLASQSSGVDFLVPGVCGCSSTVSSVGAGAGPSAAGASSAISAISAFSSFLSEKYRIRHRRSIWCCHVDKIR